eukprot:783171-Pelagomonas_calceolata.AAC.11
MSISDYDPSAGAATPRPLGRTCAAGEGRNRCALSSIPDGDPAAGAATPQPIGHACVAGKFGIMMIRDQR